MADKDSYLLLINSLMPGGAERSLVELLAPLSDDGIHPILVCLVASDAGFQQEVVDAGHDIRILDRGGWWSRIRQVRGIIAAESPRLIHTTLFESDVLGRMASIGTGVPVISTLANTTYEPERIDGDANLARGKVALVKWVDRLTALRNRHFHAVSAAVKDSAIKHLGLGDSKVTVIRRGRDPVRLGRRTPDRRERVRAELGLADAEIVLTVGRHEYQKGQIHLIDAFARIAADHPRAVLVVAGRTGNATADLETRIAHHGIENRVQLLGHRPDAPDLMAAADLFVFPSLWEGLGGVLIEALALEVPIVASDIPAIREVVGDDGGSGVLVAPGDTAAIATVMQRVLEDTDQRDAMVSRARERFESLFLLEDRSRDMIKLLKSVAR